MWNENGWKRISVKLKNFIVGILYNFIISIKLYKNFVVGILYNFTISIKLYKNFIVV